MRLPFQSSRRSGFTLIELLTVIAIIAILGALVAGAIHRVIGGQQIKRTETTVKKVQTGFDLQWRAVIDDAKEDIKKGKVNMSTFMANGVNDRDVANALYVMMKLRLEFPQTFAEARNTPSVSGFGVNSLQTKNIYVQELAFATGGTPQQEAAVLLYLSLTQSRRGVAFNVDEIGGAVKVQRIGNRDFKVIVDAWDVPITFERFTSDPGLAGELTQLANGNPLDPYGKLQRLSPQQRGFWFGRTGNPLDNQYHGPVIRSLGPDGPINNGPNDDIIGFRLMVEGQRGN